MSRSSSRRGATDASAPNAAAGKWALLTDVTNPIGDLQHTIQRTNFRFLLDKPAYTEFYDEAEGFIREMRALANCTGGEVVEPYDPVEPGGDMAPTYLIHVSQVRIEDDEPEWEDNPRWYVASERPAGGVVRYLDDTGHVFAQPTFVSCKIDKVLGPFINKAQFDPIWAETQAEQFIITQPPWVDQTR